jgi:hypothetical protein
MISAAVLRKTLMVAVTAALLIIPPVHAIPGGAAIGPRQAKEIGLEPGLTQRERSDIVKGKIVVRDIPNPGRPGRTFEALGVLPGGLDEAFTVITDYRCYPEFMPQVKRALVREVGVGHCVVEILLALPLGYSKQYRLKYRASRSDESFEVSWEMVPWPELAPGDTVKDTSGHWRVRRFESGGNLAAYRVYTDPGPVPLGLTGLAQALGKKGIAAVIDKTRRRIRSLSSSVSK